MGDLTINGLDEALLTELKAQAERQGVKPEAYAEHLLRQALTPRPARRSVVAREILAGQPKKAATDSIVFIREDRAR